MRILGLRTHYKDVHENRRWSAVDWWRIINPLTHVAKNTDWEIDFLDRDLSEDLSEDVAWDMVGQKYDLLYTSYIDDPRTYAYIKAVSEAYDMTHIMDLDDNLWEVDDMNPSYLRYGGQDNEHLNHANIIISDVEGMSVSTPHLYFLSKVRRGNLPTVVLPNSIDPEVYRYDPRLIPDNGDKIVIGYQGSATHLSDLMKTRVLYAIRRLMSENKNIYFYVIGMLFEELSDILPKDRIIMESGETDHRKWIKKWQKMPMDIGIAPLIDTSFNASKSPIKYFEYSLRKIPAVYSYVETYQNTVTENDTGFLATDEEEWYEKLKWLVANKTLRKRMADSAFKHTKENYTIQKNWIMWKQFIEHIYV